MIIYRNTKGGFVNDVKSNIIAAIIEDEFAAHNIHHNNDAEYRSWANSMHYLRNVVDIPQIDDQCQVATSIVKIKTLEITSKVVFIVQCKSFIKIIMFHQLILCLYD